MPFKSEAQRKYLWMKHPEVAREFADATPKGTKLPEHVKKAHVLGAVVALEHFGLKAAAEELRLKIPDRTFHGWDAAHKSEAKRAEKKAMFGDRRSATALEEMLRGLDDPPAAMQATASKNPLDRSTSWGPPTNPAAGDTGSRVSDMGQPTGFGGI